MKILAVEEPDPDVRSDMESHDRPAGVHISDIIKQMLIERDAKKYGDDSPIDADTIERGYVWEEVLSDALLRRHGGKDGFRPDPFQVDGVWMSPDWFNPESEFPMEEWKATRVSRKSDITDRHWYWFVQIGCYLKGTGTRKARLRVWYINGDYSEKTKRDPRLLTSYVRFTLEYSQREIDENWRSLIGFAKKHGLMEDTPSWASTTRAAAPQEKTSSFKDQLTASLQQRQLVKRRGSPQQGKSSQRGAVLTFPASKKSRTTRTES